MFHCPVDCLDSLIFRLACLRSLQRRRTERHINPCAVQCKTAWATVFVRRVKRIQRSAESEAALAARGRIRGNNVDCAGKGIGTVKQGTAAGTTSTD